ncbi:MAG TPA: 4Fe-4S dicluster domain-containing protein [Caldithrix sp.]|nr:4Fe-4S dicluster domain-containing protein [Caldithrix sp.]
MKNQISRKDFFSEIADLFKGQSRSEMKHPKRRSDHVILPPGVSGSEHYLTECTQCYDCVSVCPYQSLEVWHEEGSPFEGYPVIQPRREPCYLCSDFPCVAVCPTPALQEQYVDKPLGLAVVDQERCLAYQGNFCVTCVNNCPLAGRAIFRNEQGHPVVKAEFCTGCGICTYSCPAELPAINIDVRQPDILDNTVKS